MDDYVETEDEPGFFSKLMSSIAGIGIGIVIMLVCIPVLWWNEGRAVNTAIALTEGAAAAIHAEADKAEGGNDGKLLHINGKATAEGKLADPLFATETEGLALKRVVEMYQWEEESHTKKEKVGGKEKKVTTYTYEMVWSDDLIDSNKFKKSDYPNPSAMPWSGEAWYNKPVKVGAFELSDDLAQQISSWSDLSLPADALDKVPDTTKSGLIVADGGFYKGKVTPAANPADPPIVVADPANPAVGDVRVTYKVLNPADVSVLGQQTGTKLGAYMANGYDISDLRMGTMTKDEMFDAAQSENTMLTWIIRIGAFVGLWMAWFLVGRPVVVIADVLPFAGAIAGALVGALAFGGAALCALPTIAVAWIFYRPMLAFALICTGIGAMVGIGVVIFGIVAALKGRSKDEEPAAA